MNGVIAVRDNDTIYRDGDRCIKVFNEGYSKADVFNEALNQTKVEESGINLPKVLEITRIDGKWAIISEFVEGKTLAQLIEENPEKKREYIELLVDLQMSIHAKSCYNLNLQREKMSRTIALTELEATTRYHLHARIENMPKDNKVCHGYLEPSNVVIANDGTPYIIDWSHTTQGCAAADAARSYMLFWLNGDISGSEMYLDAYCAKSGTEKNEVKKWLSIVAASRLLKGEEKEREFLMSWIEG